LIDGRETIRLLGSGTVPVMALGVVIIVQNRRPPAAQEKKSEPIPDAIRVSCCSGNTPEYQLDQASILVDDPVP